MNPSFSDKKHPSHTSHSTARQDMTDRTPPACFEGLRYHSISTWLKRNFGEKTIKLAIDGGFTCPNRDGTKGVGGCTFCSDNGSGEFASNIEDQIRLLSDKWPRARYLAYFQNHTNTYAPVAELRKKYEAVLANPKIEGLVIGTRPDCLSEEVLDLLSEINRSHFLWLELGLQTMHEKTAQYIRRGYPLSCFEQAVNELHRRGIPVIVHTILGLPGEGQEEVFATMDYLNGLSISGIKLQLLHVLKNTDLAADYAAGKFDVLEQDAYLTLVIDCLRRLRPDLVIHRVTGDGPGDLLIAPTWSQAKRTVLNELHHRMKEEHAYQGQLLDEEKGGNTP